MPQWLSQQQLQLVDSAADTERQIATLAATALKLRAQNMPSFEAVAANIFLDRMTCTYRPYNCIDVARFLFVLMDRLNVLDDTGVLDIVGPESSPGQDPSNWVALRFHQIKTFAGASSAVLAAQIKVINKLGLHESEPGVEDRLTDTLAPEHFTIVEAITPWATGVSYREDIFTDVRLRPATRDPLNRCVRLIRDYSRALIVASERRVAPASYDRIFPMVALYSGVFNWTPEPLTVWPTACKWEACQIISLDHQNIPGFHALDSDLDVGGVRVGEALRRLRNGSPLFRFNEVMEAAKRNFLVEGDYTVSTVMSQTAGEVLIDNLLMLLAWEEGMPAEQARNLFEKTSVNSRATSELAARLKGAWHREGSKPYANWIQQTTHLRHRVVHAGYEPSWNEARAAWLSTFEFQRYCFDRVAAQRGQFPRVCLMTVAQKGLEKRDMWKGKIKRFAETDALREPSWEQSFGQWRDDFNKL